MDDQDLVRLAKMFPGLMPSESPLAFRWKRSVSASACQAIVTAVLIATCLVDWSANLWKAGTRLTSLPLSRLSLFPSVERLSTLHQVGDLLQ